MEGKRKRKRDMEMYGDKESKHGRERPSKEDTRTSTGSELTLCNINAQKNLTY